jgi:hypothetical protein
MGSRGAYLSYLAGVGLALAALTGVASGACNPPVGTSITCTGGPGAAVSVTAGGTPPQTVTASPYPSALTVSGAPAGATVATVSITLNGYTAAAPITGDNSADVGILLADPNSKNLQIVRCAGNGHPAPARTT